MRRIVIIVSTLLVVALPGTAGAHGHRHRGKRAHVAIIEPGCVTWTREHEEAGWLPDELACVEWQYEFLLPIQD